MWEPDPSWRELPGAGGPSTPGVWLAESEGRRWVVKRLAAPDERTERSPTRYAGYWRREVEVARDPAVVDGPGLVPPSSGTVEEDDDGVTVWSLELVGEPPTGLFVARALGRFAAADRRRPGWASRNLLEDRLAMAEQRGGWRTLARTTLADVADHLWQRGAALAGRATRDRGVGCTGTPYPPTSWPPAARTSSPWTGSASGSGRSGPTSATTPCPSVRSSTCCSRRSSTVWAPTWTRGDRLAARVTAVYTVLSRAEWALAQAARGEGALAGKYRHPAVGTAPAGGAAPVPADRGPVVTKYARRLASGYSHGSSRATSASMPVRSCTWRARASRWRPSTSCSLRR